MEQCWAGIERPSHPLTLLPRLSAQKIEKLESIGISDARHVPTDFSLSETQARIRDCHASGRPWASADLTASLQSIQWPVTYLDFEANQFDIPRYAGTSPFQAIAFQLSCHRQERVDGPLDHNAYLADGSSDPRPELANALLEAVGERGSIVVYSSYEARTIRSLADACPSYKDDLLALLPRLVDLLQIVKAHYYHPDFMGSYSIKSVLPTLVPSYSYDALEIADGRTAARAWEAMINSPDDKSAETIRQDLLAYCELDSMAMAELHTALSSQPSSTSSE